MWLAFYNKEALGDVLLLTRGNTDEDFVEVETQGKVTLIKNRESQEIYGVNIADISEKVSIQGKGSIQLTDEELEMVNQILADSKIDLVIEVDHSPKFVVGYVESCSPHEDSDHLSITATNVGSEVLQIVCGANNIRQGLKVLVAKPGAVMPSGGIIWPGELRGVTSQGMICSTKELNVTDLEDMPGIWELPKELEVGSPLSEVINYYQ